MNTETTVTKRVAALDPETMVSLSTPIVQTAYTHLLMLNNENKPGTSVTIAERLNRSPGAAADYLHEMFKVGVAFRFKSGPEYHYWLDVPEFEHMKAATPKRTPSATELLSVVQELIARVQVLEDAIL